MLSFEPCFGPWKRDVHAVAVTRTIGTVNAHSLKWNAWSNLPGFYFLLPSFTWSWIQDAVKSFLSFNTAFCDCAVIFFLSVCRTLVLPWLFLFCFVLRLHFRSVSHFTFPVARAFCFSLSLSCDDVCISDCLSISALSPKIINSINFVQTSQTPCSLHLLDWKVRHWMLNAYVH